MLGVFRVFRDVYWVEALVDWSDQPQHRGVALANHRPRGTETHAHLFLGWRLGEAAVPDRPQRGLGVGQQRPESVDNYLFIGHDIGLQASIGTQ